VEAINNSKKLPLKKISANIIHFPWRDKKLKRRFHWTEFSNPKLKMITLEKENVIYIMELISQPTKWHLWGKEVKASTWYRYTVSNQNEFYEWGLIRIVKEINNLLRLGCTIKEVIQ
jgi:hypothetical protein